MLRRNLLKNIVALIPIPFLKKNEKRNKEICKFIKYDKNGNEFIRNLNTTPKHHFIESDGIKIASTWH